MAEMAEAIAELANERRSGNLADYGKMGAAASAKARKNGRMPLEMCEKHWFDKTLGNAEAVAAINAHPDYRKPYSPTTLYRLLGPREVMSGRRTGSRMLKIAARKQRERLRSGAIYFIRAVDGRGPVKIGYSASPDGRLAQLQTSHHGELEIIAAIEGTMTEEKALHERFARQRLKGEWFKVAGPFKKYLSALPRYLTEKE